MDESHEAAIWGDAAPAIRSASNKRPETQNGPRSEETRAVGDYGASRGAPASRSYVLSVGATALVRRPGSFALFDVEPVGDFVLNFRR